jgi:hypothetical protein
MDRHTLEEKCGPILAWLRYEFNVVPAPLVPRLLVRTFPSFNVSLIVD